MKFPQTFRAGDFIQWRLDSTTDNFGDPISTTNFLENASSDLGIHYVPVYQKLIDSDSLGRPTTFHTDGHYNELGYQKVARTIFQLTR